MELEIKMSYVYQSSELSISVVRIFFLQTHNVCYYLKWFEYFENNLNVHVLLTKCTRIYTIYTWLQLFPEDHKLTFREKYFHHRIGHDYVPKSGNRAVFIIIIKSVNYSSGKKFYYNNLFEQILYFSYFCNGRSVPIAGRRKTGVIHRYTVQAWLTVKIKCSSNEILVCISFSKI